MSEADCAAFLQWALPRLRLRWPGFRKVRRQVCRRVRRRAAELGLVDLDAYRAFLEARPEEWDVLDSLCRVSVSRFYRDRGVFEALGREVVPALAEAALERGERALEIWSAGCASGEEPYTLALMWELSLEARFPELEARILATDVDEVLLARARRACYGPGSLRELPGPWRRSFAEEDGRFCLLSEHARAVSFRLHDVRAGPPDGPFHLVLCRNLVFTYFEHDLQLEICAGLAACLREGGVLVVGAHEALPEGCEGFEPWPGARCAHRLRQTRRRNPRPNR